MNEKKLQQGINKQPDTKVLLTKVHSVFFRDYAILKGCFVKMERFYNKKCISCIVISGLRSLLILNPEKRKLPGKVKTSI
jgi:hypothetical protein